MEHSFGSIHVYVGDQDDAKGLVREALTGIYESCGVAPVRWSDPDALLAARGRGSIPALQLNASAVLGPDDVFVLDGYCDGWVHVGSMNHEICSPLKNPIARGLSKKWSVVVTACIQDAYFEIARYEGGRVVAASVVGPQVPVLPESVPALDVTWFLERGGLGEAGDLVDALGNPDEFCALSGLDFRGLRDAFEAAPIHDYVPEDFMVMVEDPGALEQRMAQPTI